MNCPAVPRAAATEILPAADMPCPHRPRCQGPRPRQRPSRATWNCSTARRRRNGPRGARLNPARRRGPRDCGNSVDINDRGVVTDRDSSPTGGSIASPGRSPRASPCLTCLDTENALRPGNTPDPGEIINATALTEATGGNTNAVADEGGWASAATVEDTYAHLAGDAGLEAALQRVWGQSP